MIFMILMPLIGLLFFMIHCFRKFPYSVKKAVMICVGISICSLLGFCLYRYFSIERNGVVGEGYVRIGTDTYVYDSIKFTKEGKTIAKINGWSIREIPEDPEHNFLAIRSFLDNSTIVREDYVIPENGKISCFYTAHGERCTEDKVLKALDDILTYDYKEEFKIEFGNRPKGLKGITVGYEDCPVGTDLVGFIGTLDDGRWVYIKHEDYQLISDNRTCAVCYEIPEKYSKILEKCELFD